MIKRKEVHSLLSINECIIAVEEAFKGWALGEAQAPAILGIHATDGGFHIKAGILNTGREYFVAKINANFPENPHRSSLPTIQGFIAVFDALDGQLLAMIDSIEVTIVRTGAATAVAAKYLSNPDSNTVTICGCGNQGEISLKALTCVRNIVKAYVYDIDQQTARAFASRMSNQLGVRTEVVSDLKHALRHSDICVTCTTANRFFISSDDVVPGMFIAAVGADSEHKQEIDPQIFAASKVVTDSIEQAVKIGDLHHALDSGVFKREQIYGELGQIVARIKSGRLAKNETIVFDSTGIALQDVAAAAVVYEKAVKSGIGLEFCFAEM